jgi:hypothetical protein
MATVIKPDSDLYIINGDVQISGDTTITNLEISTVQISSTADIDLESPPADYQSADSALKVQGGGYIGGNLYVGGTLVANGDVITLGNAGGSLVLNSNISSHVLPSSTDTYDIGSVANSWRTGVFTQVVTSPEPDTVQPSDTAISVGQSATQVVYLNSTSGNTLVLPDGAFNGETKTLLLLETPAAPISVTPASAVGYTYFTLTNAGDSITLVYTQSGWVITSAFRTDVSN